MEPVKTILVTQARMGSTRLPGKILLKVGDDELLKIHLNRLKKCTKVDEIIVATTNSSDDDLINILAAKWGFATSRGSVDDVLDRFYQATKDKKPQWVVRVTSDCPLIDPQLVDAVIAMAHVNGVDYASNILEELFPDGQDVEVFKFDALEKAWNEAILKSDREHVTTYLRKSSTYKGGTSFSSVNFPCVEDYSNIRMTVDEQRDYELITALVNDLGVEQTWLKYTNHIITNHLNQINNNIIRNEGLLKSLKND